MVESRRGSLRNGCAKRSRGRVEYRLAESDSASPGSAEACPCVVVDGNVWMGSLDARSHREAVDRESRRLIELNGHPDVVVKEKRLGKKRESKLWQVLVERPFEALLESGEYSSYSFPLRGRHVFWTLTSKRRFDRRTFCCAAWPCWIAGWSSRDWRSWNVPPDEHSWVRACYRLRCEAEGLDQLARKGWTEDV